MLLGELLEHLKPLWKRSKPLKQPQKRLKIPGEIVFALTLP